MYPRLSEDICGLIGNDFHYTMVTVTNCTGRFGNKVTEDNLWMPYYEYERSIASAVHWEAICLFPDRPQQEHHQAQLEKATPRDAIQDQQENIRRPSNLVLCRLVCWNVVGRWLVGDLRFFFLLVEMSFTFLAQIIDTLKIEWKKFRSVSMVLCT